MRAITIVMTVPVEFDEVVGAHWRGHDMSGFPDAGAVRVLVRRIWRTSWRSQMAAGLTAALAVAVVLTVIAGA